MRYYNIAITGSQSGQQTTYSSLVSGGNSSSSLISALQSALSPAGATDPNALDIELDIYASTAYIPEGGGQNAKSFVRIHGIPLITVAQQSDLNGAAISVSGGMAMGLPLATAAASQAGLLAKGTIYPAFGNWIGTDMTLDLILGGSWGSGYAPLNISHIWQKNTQLSNAIQSVMASAFSSYTVNMNIGTNLILNYDVPWYYSTLQQFAQFLNTISRSINKSSNYPGVHIAQVGTNIYVYDGTGGPAFNVIQVQFQDLIGQPTWIGQNQISFKTVMRGDIIPLSTVQMPQAIPIQTPLASLSPQNQPSFSGQWTVQTVRHIGHYRQADAASWVSVYTAVAAASAKYGSSPSALY
jgi:hypothetical protein